MNKVERPIIYKEGELPSFLTHDSGKFLLVQESFVKEGGRGPYDWVMDFGHSRDDLRQVVPFTERITDNRRADLVFLGFDEPKILARMRDVRGLANDPARSPDNKTDRDEYKLHLEFVYRGLAREVWNRIGSEKALLFPPRNGGIFVKEVYQKCGFPDAGFFDYRMSRILGTDDRLMVGMKLGENNPAISGFRTFVFADDCLASDISAWGTLEMIKQDLEKNGISPSETRIIVAVSAGTQRGLESLLSLEARKYFGFGKIEAIAAKPVYRMTVNFYLQELEEEPVEYVVGDMGKWTKP